MSEVEARPPEWSASSRTGAITVHTTEQGLPLGISITAEELRKDPQALAAEVLRLCKRAANRAGLQRRAQLEEAGMTPEMIDLLGLPTPDAVARREAEDEDDYEMEPATWLRSV